MSNCRKLGLAIASLGCPALDRIHQIPEQQFDWARRFHRSNTLHCLVAGLRSHEPSPLAPEPSSYKHRNGTADAANRRPPRVPHSTSSDTPLSPPVADLVSR